MSEHNRGQATIARPDADESVELYLDLYRRMVLIRRFENQVQRMFVDGHIHGTTHLYSGEEAVAVGVSSVLQPQDRVAGTYRGHGHALAAGTRAEPLLAELLGKETGICAGRSGSMNVVDLEHGLIGCFAIVGGSITAATGAALALKQKSGVAVAYFGDGTTNQGYFHECLNFAKVMELPVVYICENNLYGEFTPMRDSTAGEILNRPGVFGIPAEQIDGNDVWAVRAAARRAVDTARSGGGPVFIEAMTYRFVGHSRIDPGRYRPAGELDLWRTRDPLLKTRARLTEEYGVDVATLDQIDQSVDDELAEAERAGLAAPYPTVGTPVTEFKG